MQKLQNKTTKKVHFHAVELVVLIYMNIPGPPTTPVANYRPYKSNMKNKCCCSCDNKRHSAIEVLHFVFPFGAFTRDIGRVLNAHFVFYY